MKQSGAVLAKPNNLCYHKFCQSNEISSIIGFSGQKTAEPQATSNVWEKKSLWKIVQIQGILEPFLKIQMTYKITNLVSMLTILAQFLRFFAEKASKQIGTATYFYKFFPR